MKKSVSTPLMVVIAVLAAGGIAWYAFKTMGAASGAVDQGNIEKQVQEMKQADTGAPLAPAEELAKLHGMGETQGGKTVPGGKTLPGR